MLLGCVAAGLSLNYAFAAERPFDFGRDISGIFTRQGCNDRHCHGSVKGRGGLRLSPEGADPQQDYRWIVEGGQYQVLTDQVKEPRTPRIDRKEPEKSLILLKPTMSLPHGGGRRFTVDSPEYAALLAWIRTGAPYGPPPSAHIDQLELRPQVELFLHPKESRQLTVLAHFSDGHAEDVSREVHYESANPDVTTVSNAGVVVAGARGETAIIVRGFAQTTHLTAAVIHNPVPGVSMPEAGSLPARNFIDELVLAKLRKLNIVPSGLATDEEFLRRVCLDLAGKLPPPERVREFVRDPDPHKRDRLIATLLDSPQRVDLWTFRFADLFRINGFGNQGPHWEWLRDRIAKNVPYDQIARERIAAQGSAGPVAHYSLGKPTPLERIVSEELRVFFGRRMDCAQCHNHPYDHWTQNQFWGMAAFFSRMTWTGWVAGGALYDDKDGQEVDRDTSNAGKLLFIKAINPRTKKEVQPAFLDGTPLSAREQDDPRLALANWMTARPEFAEAAVNRIWRYFFGRGIVDPPDDIRETNPATHRQLLAALAEDFRRHGHDLKRLMRLIVESRTYQLSGTPNASNRDDELNYSWSRPRVLEAEIQLDAISAATGTPEVFKTEDASVRAPEGTRAVQLAYPAAWSDRFLELGGCPLRETIPERNQNPQLAQGLHLLAGATFNAKLDAPGGRLDTLLKRQATDREIVEDLYLAALTREPSPDERRVLEQRLESQASHRREALQDLLWALLSSREFSYNH
jgi:hypothetical protein